MSSPKNYESVWEKSNIFYNEKNCGDHSIELPQKSHSLDTFVNTVINGREIKWNPSGCKATDCAATAYAVVCFIIKIIRQ